LLTVEAASQNGRTTSSFAAKLDGKRLRVFDAVLLGRYSATISQREERFPMGDFHGSQQFVERLSPFASNS
jgi:hypothetical protein